MSYNYEALSDLNSENLEAMVKLEAKKDTHGNLVFRGHTYDQWYELAYDAFESWVGGDKWGRLFENIATHLEEMEFETDLEDGDYDIYE